MSDESQARVTMAKILKTGIERRKQKAESSLAAPSCSASRWEPMDMAFGDNLRGPRRLILEAHPPTGKGPFDKWWRYTTCSESDGIGYHSENSLRTQDEW